MLPFMSTNISLTYTKLPDSTLWTVTIMNSCVVLLLVPLMLYYLNQFNARKNQIFFLKRYPNLVIYTNLPFVLVMTIYYPFNSFRKLSPLFLSRPDLYRLSGHIIAPIICSMLYYFQWLYLCRFWLMFFNLNYAKSNMNKKWKVHLDQTLIEKDFWLKHTHNLGSQRFLIKLAIFGITLSGLCELILNLSYSLNETKTNVVVSIFFILVAIIFAFVLIKYTPQIFDLLAVRKELKMLLFAMSSGISLNVIGLFFKYSSNKTISLVAMLWSMNVTLFSGCAMVFVSTWYILRKYDNTAIYNYKSKYDHDIELIEMQQAKELQRVLLNETELELFVHHLIREFCTESILSFIEMVQFKHLINSQFNLNFGTDAKAEIVYSVDKNDEQHVQKENDGTALLFNFKSCDIMRNKAIPKSFIVYKSDHTQKDVNDIKPFLEIIKKLYNKYIAQGVELEINISGQLREQYMNRMLYLERMMDSNHNKLDTIHLFQFFNPIIEEMYHLLAAICDRFLDSDPNINIMRLHLTESNTNQIEKTLAGIKIK